MKVANGEAKPRAKQRAISTAQHSTAQHSTAQIDAPIIVSGQQPELSLLDKVVVLLLKKKDLLEAE